MWRFRIAVEDRWEELLEVATPSRVFVRRYSRLFLLVLGLGAVILLCIRFQPWLWLQPGFTGKTWWDILELLVIPLFLALAALWFNSSEKKREASAAEKRRQDDILRAYFDKMGELLIDKGLLKEQDQKETPVSDYARVITITALRSIDKDRRNSILQFLRDADLSSFLLRSASLDRTNLAGAILWNFDLNGANFHNAVLDGANLVGATLNNFCTFDGASLKDTNFETADISSSTFIHCNLQRARMVGCNLSTSNLSGSDLRGTNFNFAILEGTIFSADEYHSYADLRGASFIKANLSGAHLSGVNLSGANLARSIATGTNFVLTKVRGVNFSGTDLSSAAFTGAKGLTEKQLSRAILYQTRMPSGILRSSQPETTPATT